MRRSLSGIVPEEVLYRKRKASIARGPAVSIGREWEKLMNLTDCMYCDSFGILVPVLFREALRRARDGHDQLTVPLLRAFGVELWLRHVMYWNVFSPNQLVSRFLPAEQGTRPSVCTRGPFSMFGNKT